MLQRLRNAVSDWGQVYSWLNKTQRLNKTQWYSSIQLHEMQKKMLKALLTHAYEKVPYYHRVFKERRIKPENIKGPEDLVKLPILTKQHVRKHFYDLMSIDIAKRQSYLSHTSGSTGKPLKFYLGRQALIMERAVKWLHWKWAGINFIDKKAVLRGSVIEKGGQAYPWCYIPIKRQLMMSSFHMTPSTLKQYTELLQHFKPKLLRGYPSALYILAKYMKCRDIDKIQPQAIQTSSETLLPHQRKLIEEQFDCKIFDWYGNGEMVSAIGQCAEGEYHICSEYGIIEFLRGGKHVSPGEIGDMICTGLNNYAMPLIRYHIGDVAKPKEEMCSCGRGLPLVNSIEGRMDDIIVTVDGRFIPPAGMTLAFEYIENIEQCQIFQKDIDELVIKIVKKPQYSDEDTRRVKE